MPDADSVGYNSTLVRTFVTRRKNVVNRLEHRQFNGSSPVQPMENQTMTQENQTPVQSSTDYSIGSEIAKARKILGLTQVELARRSGISRDSLNKYESGKHLPGARELRLLCDALGVSPNRLLLGSDEFNPPSSLLPALFTDGESSEHRDFLRFMVVFRLLTTQEQKAVMTMMESIIVGRIGIDAVNMMMAAMEGVVEAMNPEVEQILGIFDADAMTPERKEEINKQVEEKIKKTAK